MYRMKRSNVILLPTSFTGKFKYQCVILAKSKVFATAYYYTCSDAVDKDKFEATYSIKDSALYHYTYYSFCLNLWTKL